MHTHIVNGPVKHYKCHQHQAERKSRTTTYHALGYCPLAWYSNKGRINSLTKSGFVYRKAGKAGNMTSFKSVISYLDTFTRGKSLTTVLTFWRKGEQSGRDAEELREEM